MSDIYVRQNNDHNLRAQLSSILTDHDGRIGYTLPFAAGSGNPADSTAYYVGNVASIAAITAATNFAVLVPRSGTITVAQVMAYAVGTAGSNEAWELYIRVNDTTDYLIASVASTDARRMFVNTALAIAVAQGDSLILKTTTPAWATNPTSVVWSGSVFVN